MTAKAALRRLVEASSFTRDRAGVLRVGELVEALFAPLGFLARRVRSEIPEAGDHLVLEKGGRGGPPLVLVGHLDTVYPRAFPWREEEGRIFGPGTCDMKGGIVVMWLALRELAGTGFLDRARWTLLFNATEEGGCADFPPLARAVAAGARACLVYEPGLEAEEGATTLTVRRKGALRFRVDVTGREAHSGHAHEKGASAIRELARRIEALESLTDYGKGVTLNVGLVEGGTTVNSVPLRASCHVDLRAWTPEEAAQGRARVLAMAGEGSVPGTRVDVAELPGYPPWPANEGSERLAQLAVEAGTGLGLRLAPRPRGGGSDGCHLWDLAPTLDGLGAVGRNPHVAEGADPESVDLPSLAQRGRLSAALLRRLLEG
jgi:glutamate carboxypeptidase